YQSGSASKDEISGLKAYTYNLGANNKIEEIKLRNENIFEEKTSKYLHKTKFTMPDIREGSVIEYKYTIKSPYISNIDEFRFQETIPVEKVEVRFASPEYFVFKTHQKGWVPYKVDKNSRSRTMSFNQTVQDITAFSGDGIPHTTRREVNFKEDIYQIAIEAVPAIKEEAYVGNIDNYSTGLKFELSYIDFPGSSIKTFSTTWEDVSKSIYKVDSFGNELERNNYFEDDLGQLLSGVSNPEEKVFRIFS